MWDDVLESTFDDSDVNPSLPYDPYYSKSCQYKLEKDFFEDEPRF